MLSHPKGGLKDLPASARKTAFLNQNEPGRINSEDLAALRSLLEKYDSVLIGQVVTQDEEDQIAWCLEPIAGIILAAGGSRRFGRSKQLLTYDGKPMVRRVAETALKSGLDPVVLVTGEDHERVLEAVFDLPVQIVNNPDWRSGVSTSIQAGLRVLPERSAGAVFLLADQPQIPAELIDRLLQSHASNQADITAPYVGERRGNPVLFDRRLFAELNELHGDVGGRALFDRHPVHPVYWEDDSILADIDTPEDYDQFIKGRHEH
ncbi:MAG TPA: nucleotidyltransferase family protein [Chloroflexi bacterium]|nr:nucleotidyltransferase family protein [Chloroflexota bacterium]